MMKQNVYVVHAFRWGDTNEHGYVVGVYARKKQALDAAKVEEEYRGGGKYLCEVTEWVIGEGIAGKYDAKAKVVKSLPEIPLQNWIDKKVAARRGSE